MGFSDLDKSRVLEATDIASVVGEAVRLIPKGREFVGLCPFHDDRKPSMYVVPHKGIFHCFACGAGGDAITFLMRFYGLEFPEAVRKLAERAGIDLEETRGPARGNAGHPAADRVSLGAACATAAAFFRVVLTRHEAGEAARSVVERRGISVEASEAFGLGASPDRWDGLVLAIRAKGLDPGPFVEAGLLKERETGGLYDALRNRLIFPIRDESGRVIAFGGRRVNDEDEPKYLNSPETPLFRKSRTLYGLDLARSAIRREGRAVVVEGYTDVIACHQAGLANVVGTLGTALTPEHARRLRGHCDEVVLFFDGDEAGQRAADRAFEVLFSARMDVRVAIPPADAGAKDPDEILQRGGGPDALRALLDGAEHLIDFWARRFRERTRGLGPSALSRELEDEIRRLGDLGLRTLEPAARRPYVRRLAEAAGVPEAEVLGAIPRGRRRGPAEPSAEHPAGGLSPLFAELLGMVLLTPEAAAERSAEGASALRSLTPGDGSAAHRVSEAVCALLDRGAAPTGDAVRAQVGESDVEADALRAAVVAHASMVAGENAGEAVEALAALLARCGVAVTRSMPAAERLERLRRAQAAGGTNPAANPWRRSNPRGPDG